MRNRKYSNPEKQEQVTQFEYPGFMDWEVRIEASRALWESRLADVLAEANVTRALVIHCVI